MPALPVDALRGLIDRRLALLPELTGLPVVFGGAIDRSRRADHLVISELRGALSDALPGLAVPSGRGLGGLALEHSKPFVVSATPRSFIPVTHAVSHSSAEDDSGGSAQR